MLAGVVSPKYCWCDVCCHVVCAVLTRLAGLVPTATAGGQLVSRPGRVRSHGAFCPATGYLPPLSSLFLFLLLLLLLLLLQGACLGLPLPGLALPAPASGGEAAVAQQHRGPPHDAHTRHAVPLCGRLPLIPRPDQVRGPPEQNQDSPRDVGPVRAGPGTV